MRYLGSKRRFAKQLVPILMEHVGVDTTFVDAFCGGCNIVSEMPCANKVALDINRYITAFWVDVISEYTDGVPFTCMSSSYTEETYRDVRESYRSGDGRYKDSFIGFVGSAGSWGGGWFKGYPRYNPKKNEDHILEAYRGVEKQLAEWKHISGTKIFNMSYDEFDYPAGSVIYCDPPYMGTEKYERDRTFDHDRFWEWVRVMSKAGHRVYVSEYSAPSDFKVVWSARKKDGLANYAGKKQATKIEKLFIYGEER